ncbi:MAG: ABC-type Fe3+-hydroxamate transport system substrate-binding protein [Gammaproteobacteria bacterium]
MNDTDAAGTRHAPAGDAARIVCLVPSITELLFDLGLGDNVVGRTGFCIHPAQFIDAIPRVGGTKTPRLDRIADLRATHAIVNIDENRREDAQALRQMGVEVIVTHPCEPTDNLALFMLMGTVFNRLTAAQALCQRFDAALSRLREVAAQRPRRRVLYLIWREPWMTISPDTYIAKTLAAAGLDVANIDDAARYPQVAIDSTLLTQVDEVLLSSEPYPFKSTHRSELQAAGGPQGPAVNFIDGEMTSWYGSRAIAGCSYLAGLRTQHENHDPAPYTRTP